jgi:hypothetical protein
MNQVTNGLALSNQKRTAVISQAELAELLRLREQNRRHNELRNKLTNLLERGADIEPGPLTAHIDRKSQTRFSKSELIRLLGETKVTQLQRRLTPTTNRYLKIVEKGVTR